MRLNPHAASTRRSCTASRRNDHSPGAFSVRNATLSISDNQSGTTSRTTCFVWEGQSSDRFFRMIPINLRLENKLISKNLIAALAPLPRVLGRYREARKSLRGSISRQSRQGLDWMNFFLADVQTAFGAFVAFYLADLGWSKDHVGLALTAGTLAGVISQIPGGALADAVRWKRGLAAIGIGMICTSALLIALMPSFALVFFAEILHGLTAGIVTPAIAAISLGLVGRRAMSLRTGRNYQFNAAGNALTAGLMRMSHTTKRIGAPNQRKWLCGNDFRAIRGAPRYRQ